MRKAIGLCIGASLLATSAFAKVNLAAERDKVAAAIDQFAKAWETKDIGLLSKVMAHDPDMVINGTDAPEHWTGWEAFKADVEKMLPALENLKITVKERAVKVHPAGKVAWFAQVWDWDFRMEGKPVQSAGQRFTGVLENRDGAWVIVQFHNSVPVVPAPQ